jgi:hypothetical protein
MRQTRYKVNGVEVLAYDAFGAIQEYAIQLLVELREADYVTDITTAFNVAVQVEVQDLVKVQTFRELPQSEEDTMPRVLP